MRVGLVVAAICASLFVGWASPAGAGILIAIDKGTQRMAVTVDGVRKYVWPVSTGAPGYTTPSGTYTPFRLEKDHFSEEWDDAPMPHSIFFTYQGHAIHGSIHTRRLGSPVSHGCVRLAPENAAVLYELVETRGLGNTRIVLADSMPTAAGKPIDTRPEGTTPKKKKKFVSPFYMDRLTQWQ
ncbi:MAG TPA: L,D-transpeptidase [Bauldia sp.]|nr:L,D-transpeptidase [Bauldia sp.]